MFNILENTCPVFLELVLVLRHSVNLANAPIVVFGLEGLLLIADCLFCSARQWTSLNFAVFFCFCERDRDASQITLCHSDYARLDGVEL